MSSSIAKVLKVFKKHYQPIPLEVYGTDPYKTLVSTLLSTRTRDETTFAASERLFKKAPNIKTLDQLEIRSIRKLIYPVGFYKTKAKNLKRTAEIIVNQYNGKIPSSRDMLKKLPGIGQKTANLILARAFGQSTISVDTHVHKISNLLGWVKTKTPEQTERELMKVVPKKYWREVNRLLVSIGKQFRSKRKLIEFLKESNLFLEEKWNFALQGGFYQNPEKIVKSTNPNY